MIDDWKVVVSGEEELNCTDYWLKGEHVLERCVCLGGNGGDAIGQQLVSQSMATTIPQGCRMEMLLECPMDRDEGDYCEVSGGSWSE